MTDPILAAELDAIGQHIAKMMLSPVTSADVENLADMASRLFRDNERLRARVKRLESVCYSTAHDVEQILGKALGYPWFKDDQKNFPGATEADGVCVGEHVPESIAAEAANRIERVERERDRLERIVLDQQAEIKRLETANDRLQVEFAERGKVNARLNKELQRALAKKGESSCE